MKFIIDHWKTYVLGVVTIFLYIFYAESTQPPAPPPGPPRVPVLEYHAAARFA